MASTKTPHDGGIQWRALAYGTKNAPVTVTKFHRGKVRELSFPDPAAPSIAREIAFASLLFAIRGNFSARIAPSLSLHELS